MLTNVLRGAAALLATCGLAAAAPAADAMTVRLGDPELVARVAIKVPIVAACSPFDPALTHVSDSVSVSVQQASGQDIAFGSAFVSGSISGGMGLPSPLFACDGTEQTVLVTVSANPNGPPFHGGPAVMTAGATASAAQPCFPGSTNCFVNFVSQSASTGAVRVRL